MTLRILKGNEISEKLFLEALELDNTLLSKKHTITKEKALEWFYASNKSIIIAYDEDKKEILGYFYYFLLKHSFLHKYITTNKNFKSIRKNDFYDFGLNKNADIFIFRTLIKEKYQNTSISSDNNVYNNKKIFRIMNNSFLEDVCEIKRKGISINYVISELPTEEGKKYLKSLGLQPCFAIKDGYKYASLFNIGMFKQCDNYKLLTDIYKDNKYCNKYDRKLLENHDYLSFKNDNLYYRNINLYELAKKHGTPLEVAYLNLIPERINSMKEMFDNAISKYDYKGKYIFAYATKANYFSEVIHTISKHLTFLETSSAYDISIIEKILENKFINSDYTIICNGLKNEKYVDSIGKLLRQKVNVIPVIENEEEFDILSTLNFNFNVGIRYNCDFESRLIKNDFQSTDEHNNRFGLNKEELFKMAKKITQKDNMNFEMFHFHFGGTITDIDNYIKGFKNIFTIYCELKKLYPSLKYFDFGGGFPVKYSLMYNFDYEYLVSQMVKTALDLCNEFDIEMPDLVGEHGRYTVADHSFYIYKVDFIKEYEKNWYILNTSLMNFLPDIWGIEQDFTFLPVNYLNRKCIPVILGGSTCDPDDRYFLDEKNVELFMPKINDSDELYVAVFSVGAYQKNISGIGGVHHCMIPEGKQIIIHGKNNDKILKVNDVQTAEEMLDLLGYNNEKRQKL